MRRLRRRRRQGTEETWHRGNRALMRQDIEEVVGGKEPRGYQAIRWVVATRSKLEIVSRWSRAPRRQ